VNNIKIALMTLNTIDKIETTEGGLLKIVKYLSKNGYIVDLLIPKSSTKRRKLDNVNHLEITCFSYPLKNNVKLDGLIKEIDYMINLLNILQRKKYDVIYNSSMGPFYTNSLLSILLCKLKDVSYLNEWLGSDLLIYDNIIRKVIKRLVLSNSSINLVQSKYMYKKAKKISKNSLVFVNPTMGVDLNKFRPKYNGNSNSKREGVNILFVGRLHPVKGLDYLIDAFVSINEKYPKTKLNIVGDGELKNKLERKVKTLGIKRNVNFYGHVPHDELVNYYQNADLFVLPSLSEGLGHVLLEAMACGLPLIATDVAGPKELVDERKGGFLVSPKKSESIKEAIEMFIEKKTLLRKMGSYNIKKVKKYSQKKVMKEKKFLIDKLSKK